MPRSIDVPGLAHNAPIPVGARVANVLCSSAIAGKDPATGKLAAVPADQARLAFDNLKHFLDAGGATLADVVKLTIYVKDDSVREYINAHWLAFWPDPAQRPARHIVVHDLQHGMALQLETLAVIA
ncbi:RidA family protein [Paraburkholderia dinghuensis]|uniref:RidA family protein n=1 Tax=Paraburkholderia dinghuensis TaxID=2305225 RepID=A0A3N6MWR6_9BURK|nr:RidA family protein [Paraburkholderia dinghuensis]RQH06395.1 RidA family protein [Paraburkholderia dinghuensis]